MPETIVYCGAVAQAAGQGGLAWFHLQFLLGLRRLGHEVLLVDRLDATTCTDGAGRPVPFAESVQRRGFLDVVRQFGFADRASLSFAGGDGVGIPRRELLARARHAALLINVMGYCDDPDLRGAVGRRVFLDIDPGFPQMWRELGLHDAFAGHERCATLARRIGRPGCTIPTCGLDWITLPQPIVLEHWPAVEPCPGGAFTSVGAWRGPNGPVTFGDRTYGLRCHEFRRFLDLPDRCPGAVFEQALAIDPGDARDHAALLAHGWRLVDPRAVAGTPDGYRAYVGGSKGELVVPKEMYVATRGGLLSDRSCCYLASGRPVVARDTGLAESYPLGTGLIAFTTPEEAAAGIEAIGRDYRRHCRAARDLAVEHFDSDRVLPRFVAAALG